MSVKDLLGSKPYSPKIKNHPIFRQKRELAKIFPLIGLPNSSEETIIDMGDEVKVAAENLIVAIRNIFQVRVDQLTKVLATKRKLADEKREKTTACLAIINGLLTSLEDPDDAINVANKVSLNIPCDISVADKVILHKGERLFGAYNKLNEMLVDGGFARLPNIDKMPEFKVFSTKNIPTDGGKVIFSSDGEDGLWDIATMSMRGIESCQSWQSGNATHVVGSMVDPFTGIIYLTSGAPHKNMGAKMMRRCIVRFIVNDKRTQALFLEKMYPAEDLSILKSFKDFLVKRTGGKYKVLAGNGNNLPAGYYVPLGGLTKFLDDKDRPYRDSGITYRLDDADHIGKFKSKSASIISELSTAIGVKLMAGLRNSPLPETSKETFKIIRGTHKSKNISHFIYSDIVNRVSKFLSKDKFEEIEDPHTAMAELLKEFGSELERFMVKEIKTATKANLKRLTNGSDVVDKVADDIVDIFGIVAKQAAGKVSGILEEKVAAIDEDKSKIVKVNREKNLYLGLLN